MTFDFGNSSSGNAPRKKQGFMSAAAAGDDPLADVPVTDSLQADAEAELGAVEQGWRARRDRESDRFRQATDSEYWVAVCFRDREHKDRFLAQIDRTGRLGDKYVDGHQFAKLLGMDIEEE